MDKRTFWSFQLLIITVYLCSVFFYCITTFKINELEKTINEKIEQLHRDISNEIDARFNEKN